MTMMQRTGIRPMAAGAQGTDSGSKVEADHYVREA